MSTFTLVLLYILLIYVLLITVISITYAIVFKSEISRWQFTVFGYFLPVLIVTALLLMRL